MNKSPFKLLQKKEIYQNPWMKVMESKFLRQTGEEDVVSIVQYRKSVSILALNAKFEVYLVKEFLFAREEFGIQLPSGGIEEGQTPNEAAKKELLDETGLVATTWTELGYVHPFTKRIKNTVFLYLAEGVQEYQKPVKDVEVMAISLENAYKMVMNSEITHAPSCVAILKAKDILTERMIKEGKIQQQISSR